MFLRCALGGFRVVPSVGRLTLRKAMGICASRLFPAQPPVSEYDTKSGKNRQKRHLSLLRPFRQIWKTGENVLSLCSEKRGYAPRAYPLFRAIDYQRLTHLLYVHPGAAGCTYRNYSPHSRRYGAGLRLRKSPFSALKPYGLCLNIPKNRLRFAANFFLPESVRKCPGARCRRQAWNWRECPAAKASRIPFRREGISPICRPRSYGAGRCPSPR